MPPMEFVLIPTNSKSETAFFVSLLKKMQKQTATLSSEEMEDLAFVWALREAENTGEGSLANVKDHLSRVAAGK